MGFIFVNLGIAASVYLGVFTIYLGLATYIVIKNGWKTKFTVLLFYGTVRLAGQISGIGFASLGFEKWQWLVAYLVFGAEGYFGLVMATLYFLIHEQVVKYGKSPLETVWFNTRIPFLRKPSFKTIFHWSLLPANVFIICGGTSIAGATSEELKSGLKILVSKALRAVGQVVFLIDSLSVSVMTIRAYFKGLKNRPMLFLMFLTPFITVRGIFGILAIFISKMNYFDFTNYESGSNDQMAIYEYLLGITMEFVSAFTMLNIYWVQREPRNMASIEESFELNSSKE